MVHVCEVEKTYMHSGLEQYTIYRVKYSNDSHTYTQSKSWAVSPPNRSSNCLCKSSKQSFSNMIVPHCPGHTLPTLLITRTPHGLNLRRKRRWCGNRNPPATLRSSTATISTPAPVSKPSQNRIHTVWNLEIKKLTTCNKTINSSGLGVHVISKRKK